MNSFRRLAIKYIQHLQYLLSFPPNQKIPQHIVSFDPNVPAWGKSAVPPASSGITEAPATSAAKFTLDPVNPKNLVLVSSTPPHPATISHVTTVPVLPPQVSLVTATDNVITMDTTPTLTSEAVVSEEGSWKQDGGSSQPTLNAAAAVVFDEANN